MSEQMSLDEYKKQARDYLIQISRVFIPVSLDEYKKQVRDYLIQISKVSIPVADRWMKEYDPDFPELLEENWPVGAVVAGIMSNLL